MVMKVSSDKHLSITKGGNTYAGENKAEIIKILLSKQINGIDIKDSRVWLSFINSCNEGQTLDLTSLIQDFSDAYHCVEIPMYNIFTGVDGEIQFWIRIVNTETKMIAKTNLVTHLIQPHKEVEAGLSEQDASILENLVLKVDEINEYIERLQEGVVLLAEKEEE